MSQIPPVSDQPRNAVAAPVKTDRLAWVTLMLGILAFLTAGLTGIVAIIIGAVNLTRVRQQRATGHRLTWVGILLAVIAIIVFALGGIILAGRLNDDAARKQQQTQTSQHVKTARQNVTQDVRATTANAKAYLVKNPDATFDEMLKNIRVVNSNETKGEAVVLGGVAINPAKAYQSWSVTGTDESFKAGANYNYQSYSNTFRWSDNKTGTYTDVIVDKTPRNTGALGK